MSSAVAAAALSAAVLFAATNAPPAGPAGLLAIALLLGLLIVKEILTASTRPRDQMVGRALTVAIVPLLVYFSVTAAIAVLDVIR